MGTDSLLLPRSGTGAAGGPWELEVAGLTDGLVTADLPPPAPRLRMLQGPERR